jgi:hypothetical protein
VAGKKQLPKVKERARRMTVIAGPIRPPEPDLSKGVPVPDADGRLPLVVVEGEARKFVAVPCMKRVVPSIAVIFLCILAAAAGATPDCAWVLWVEAPEGSDQWNIPKVPESRFTVKADCQRRADDLNVFEATMTKAHGTSREAHDAFTCFPCTVDPRPEGALLYEGAKPPGIKKK